MLIIKRLKQHLPVTHLTAVIICTVIIALTAMLMPSQDAPASVLNATSTSAQPLPLKTSTADSTSTLSQQQIQQQPQQQAYPQSPDVWQDFTVRQGDTLTSIFKRAGLSSREAFLVSTAVKDTEALKRIYPGQTLSFVINDQQLYKLKHIRNQLNSSLIIASEQGYEVKEIEKQPDIQPRFIQGSIENSLFLDASRAGLSDRMIMELAAIFGWDIDFVLDLRQGDHFNLVYEERFLDNQKIGEGNILSAQFVNQGQSYTAIRYTDSQGNSRYYTPQGDSMRKAFLRSPVDFARISSSFKTRRKHPVLGLTRAHKGTDYAARTGTPIKASGDGKIIWRGKKGGYGNCVIVQHGGNITTLYAHMSNYRKGQKNGSRVQQGDVIGYVGQTGLASGPHLHYEFRVNGVHKNPQTVKLPHASPINKAERGHFFSVAEQSLAQLEAYKATQLASLSD
ncbi:peptidoglycan DD-metalloendopeptidase family protein [Amphritea sp. 1_MG-2023]|uniref:OapA family protein n=1 Tax=Amphritea sp. 1_MG-2023 TaxID=3062670 RepID=UPI0026E31E10|nr:peptidoglycan DD-metalloendopeptidase family protein [Amphritea sp. 1_MG-2023]MDO6563882.1 peptidoglycan DD-metalloendopeptidase family protein [Amphritea sp. 1_MG-2023]